MDFNLLFNLRPEQVAALGTSIVSSLAFLAAIGGLSSAIVDVIKGLTAVRMGFNRRFLLSWFNRRMDPTTEAKQKPIYGLRLVRPQNTGDSGTVRPTESAYAQAVELATGGHERALLDLQTEQLCGQLTAAAQIAIEYPRLHPELFAVLSEGADDEDRRRVLDGKPPASDPAAREAYLEARVRVQHHVQRSLDALHILLAARWRWLIQLFIFVLCGLVTALLLYRVRGSVTFWQGAASYLVMSVVAGFLAPVAHDLVAAIRKWRA